MEYIIFAAIGFIIVFLAYKQKRLTPAKLVLFSGTLKSGKSMLCLQQAYKDYCRRMTIWKLKYFFRREVKENKPIFYSNIQLNMPNKVITCWFEYDHLIRQARLAPNCVVFLDEAALVARSSDWTDIDVSDTLTDFIKLYAHETWGGSLYIDTQNLADLHHSIKRCISTYYFIHHTNIYTPFFCVMHLKEMFQDPSTGNGSLDRLATDSSGSDIVTSLRWCLCPKKVWKWYDRYTFSILTDDLPLLTRRMERKDKLKTSTILRLRFPKRGKRT